MAQQGADGCPRDERQHWSILKIPINKRKSWRETPTAVLFHSFPHNVLNHLHLLMCYSYQLGSHGCRFFTPSVMSLAVAGCRMHGDRW